MAVSTLTSKRQITVPSELVRRWKLKQGDGLLFLWEGDSVRVVPIRRTPLLELRGSVQPKQPFASISEIRQVAREERASRHAHAKTKR